MCLARIVTTAAPFAIQAAAARAAVEEAAGGDVSKAKILELRQEMHRERLSVEGKLAEAAAAAVRIARTSPVSLQPFNANPNPRALTCLAR